MFLTTNSIQCQLMIPHYRKGYETCYQCTYCLSDNGSKLFQHLVNLMDVQIFDRRLLMNQNLSCFNIIQSTLVISNSKGLSEILRDIRTSTYQICGKGKKLFAQPHLTNIYVIGTLDVRDILKNIVEKRRNCS